MASLVPLTGETRLVQSVCAFILKGKWNNLFNHKFGLTSCISTSIIHQVILELSFYGREVSLSWGFYKWVESVPETSDSHSLKCSWSMIHILTKFGYFQNARELLEKIAHKDFLSSPSVLNALVTTHDDPDINSQILSWLVIYYANLRMTYDAIQVFEQIRTHGFRPHLPACTVLLNSLVKDGLTTMVWKVFKKIIRVGVVPNLHIYNVLIHACCKSGDVEKAESLFSEMELKGVVPDLFTFNTLISLYCKRGMHYEALSVQNRMESRGISPDIVTYNSLIYGYCKEGRMPHAVRLFREIKAATPNNITYTTLIDGYCRLNDLEEALRLCKVMEAKGLYLGVVTYNSILRMLCKEGRIKHANELLKEMNERKIQPDNITCNTLINAYCKNMDMGSALKVKNKMLEAGLKLDQFTYKALIHGFCKVQEMIRAKELLFCMADAGFSPNYCTYSWIVDGFCNHGNEDAILKLPNEFVERGHIVNVSIYRALIRRLCKIERLDWAEKLFSLMQGKNISADSVIYTSLAYAYLKAGKSSFAMPMLDEMYKRRLTITRRIYECFNASYASDNDIIRVFWDHMVERGVMSKGILKEMQVT